jgi:hypothetical protein
MKRNDLSRSLVAFDRHLTIFNRARSWNPLAWQMIKSKRRGGGPSRVRPGLTPRTTRAAVFANAVCGQANLRIDTAAPDVSP